MCKHNDDDYDCLDCCYETGEIDALEGYGDYPPYKDFDQCDAYHNGWLSVIQ